MPDNKGHVAHMGELLAMLNRGTFMRKLNDELATAVAALEALPTNKGKAEIKISLKLVYENGRFDVKPDYDVKLPKNAFTGGVFWGAEGKLSVNHPNQHDMFQDS